MENKTNFAVQWHLTDNCNLKCNHCYGCDAHSELSFSEIKSIVLELSTTINIWDKVTSLTKSINYTGGEPLLYDKLFDLIEYSNREGFFSTILTNGTLIDKSKARIIKNLEVRYVQISLDDISEKHDLLRGVDGAFRMAMRGISNLVNEGVPVNISCTLSRHNISRIEDLLSLVATIGASAIRFPRLIPIGRGKQLNDAMLSRNETKSTFTLLKKLRDTYIGKIDVVLDDPLFTLLDTVQEYIYSEKFTSFCEGGCSIGFTGICIMPDGTLYPCRKLPIPLGNITNKSFRDIWTNSVVLNEIRDKNNLKGNCRNCCLSYKCKGCRAVAYSSYGDYLNNDIQCWKDIKI